MSVPDVSIVVVSYNTCQLTLRCLDSLFEAVIGMTYEVVVVDNNSSDNTVLEIKLKYPDVTVVSNWENVGFARAVNQALAIASGRYVLLLNSDLHLERSNLIRLIRTVEMSRVGMAGGLLKDEKGKPQVSFGHFLTIRTLFNESFSIPEKLFGRKFPKLGHKYPLSGQTFEVDYASGAFFLVRREVIEDIGGLDERFFMYFEEMDWCRRAKSSGWKVVCDPECNPVHSMGASFHQEEDRYNSIKDSYFYTSLSLYANKYGLNTGPVRLVIIVSSLVKLLCFSAQNLVRGRNILHQKDVQRELFKIRFFKGISRI